MRNITILAVEGCVSSSISNLIDAFTIANLEYLAFSGQDRKLFETRVVTQGGVPVNCGRSIQINPQGSLSQKNSDDYLIIPAFMPVPPSGVLRDPEILDYISSSYASGVRVVSVCTGAFLLAETGLLNSRIATTNWMYEKKFKYRYPLVNLEIGRMLTEEDNLICSGAVTAIMHLALHIIRREGSIRLGAACAKAMLVDVNDESQAPYVNHLPAGKHGDNEILKAEEYMREHVATIASIDDIAGFVCISPRHFKRRFKKATGDSPLTYLQKLRIHEAKQYLESTTESIEDITRQVGYENSCTFRRLFKRYTSLSPREYRDKFFLAAGDF